MITFHCSASYQYLVWTGSISISRFSLDRIGLGLGHSKVFLLQIPSVESLLDAAKALFRLESKSDQDQHRILRQQLSHDQSSFLQYERTVFNKS